MKNHNIISFICLFLALVGTQVAEAQKVQNISLSFTNESIAFPFTSYSEFHPGFELGTSLSTSEKRYSLRHVNVYAGWFLHQHIENGFYLRGEYSYSLKLGKSFTTGIYGGAGYMHTFYPGDIFEIEPETGEFSPAQQWG